MKTRQAQYAELKRMNLKEREKKLLRLDKIEAQFTND